MSETTGRYGEPWRVSAERPHNVVCADAFAPASMSFKMAEERAARVIACVNACAGLSIPADAPVGWVTGRLDALLAELENIANADPSKWDESMRGEFQAWAQSRARAAIAKDRGAA